MDGKIERYSPASDAHHDLSDWLTSVLRVYVEAKKLGVIRSAPFQMKTGPDLPGRAPDIIFLRNENLGMLKHTYLDGPADLALDNSIRGKPVEG